MQVRDDVVTVLTNRAVPAQQLDAVAAAEELETLGSQLVTTESDYIEHEKAVGRVRGRSASPSASSP